MNRRADRAAIGLLRTASAVALALALLISASAPVRGEFQTSGRLEQARANLRRVQLGNDFRYALRNPPRRFGVTIRPNARLRFAYANNVNAWRSDLGELDIRITLRAFNGDQLLLFRVRHKIEQEPVWHDFILPLTMVAGRTGALELSASAPDGTPKPELMVWTNPILEPSPLLDRPNLILISIDTLRADHLGYAGYERPTSPHIDRLAREGVVFRQAIASSPWTLPSHASMFTGLQPTRHRAVRFGFAPLKPNFDTLAESLWDLGYETAAFTGGGFVTFGLDQGFDRFWMPGQGATKVASVSDTLARAKQWIAARPHSTFFLFLHSYAVHMPYEPPPPYNLMFDPGYAGPYRDGFSAKDAIRLGEARDPAVIQRMISLYDGEISHFDAQLGEVLNYVRNSAFGDRTCVVLTSDHGEEFNEHGALFHSRARLFDELVRIPLVVWCPARYAGGQVIDTPVSLVDVTPTMLDMAGAPLPRGVDGRSLEPALLGAPLAPQPALSEVDGSLEARTGTVRAVRSSTHKLVESSVNDTRELYDLANDPGETTDVSATQAQVADALRADLPPLPTPAPPPVRDEETRKHEAVVERLRALGYFQ